MESLLGIHLEVDKLHLSPCLPAAWRDFRIHYRYRNTFYHITIRTAGDTVHRLTLDGSALSDDFIPLVDDGRDHTVEVVLPAGSGKPTRNRFNQSIVGFD